MSSLLRLFFFFFNKKTAYDMRIIDWSSDVCSSDLDHRDKARRICWHRSAGTGPPDRCRTVRWPAIRQRIRIDGTVQLSAAGSYQRADIHARANNAVLPAPAKLVIGRAIRSAERRVGRECVRVSIAGGGS